MDEKTGSESLGEEEQTPGPAKTPRTQWGEEKAKGTEKSGSYEKRKILVGGGKNLQGQRQGPRTGEWSEL